MRLHNNTIVALFNAALEEMNSYYPPEESRAILYQLFEYLFDIKRTTLALKPETRLNETQMVKLITAVKRVCSYEPLQYITHQASFLDFTFYVDNRVLIPRPETEELVSLIIKTNSNYNNLSVVDLCSGSGCIAITLDKKLNNPIVTGVEISPDAIAVAKKNAQLLESNTTFLQQDILTDELTLQGVDIVVSNPPYVTMKEQSLMQQNVVKHEPHLALFVEDNNALLFYKRVAIIGKKMLKKGGQLWLEINEAKGEECTSLLQHEGYENITLIQDFRGASRFISATHQ